ncbi:MAG: hypothetical protein LBV18_04975 [Alistipes sp.]|jgi:hypothetical protein|nr:hypothetical protein [Alistipes sp.]
MKKLVIICFVCLFPLVASAQKRMVVYLNNGNTVRGEIVEKKINGDITLVSDEGQTLEYSQFDYYKLEQGREPKYKEQRRYVSFEDRTGRAYFFAAELSGAATIEQDLKPAVPIQLSVVNGIRLGQFLQVGVGVGVRYYASNGNVRYYEEIVGGDQVVQHEYSPWAFPIYASLRGNFISHDGRNLVPYWSLDAGYTLGDKQFYVSPTLGVSIGGYRNNVLVGVFYMGQFMKEPFGTSLKENSMLDGLGLKVGFQF